MRFQVPRSLLAQTFDALRGCGRGHRECQVLWTSAWERPEVISAVVHPQHRAHAYGFELSSAWISQFWRDLARAGQGIRVQVHTHPEAAFHSAVDDAYPIIHTVGFLSLVIPNFGMGPVGFEQAYLAEIAADGTWREVSAQERLVVVP